VRESLKRVEKNWRSAGNVA